MQPFETDGAVRVELLAVLAETGHPWIGVWLQRLDGNQPLKEIAQDSLRIWEQANFDWVAVRKGS